MCMLLNFIIALTQLPKKFYRHCWRMSQFVFYCSVAQTIIGKLHQWELIDHYVLILIVSYVILFGGVVWFIWRAYVGMERDLDFYDDF